MTVSSERRLKRLKDLLDQLERLPASADRDRMLREVRGRVVDLDTGEPPRAMMPVDATPDPAPRTVRAPRSVRRMPADEGRRPRAVPLPEPAKPAHVASLGADELLSLEPSGPLPPLREARAEPAGAWRRGLRG
jgi:hypothetical protein